MIKAGRKKTTEGWLAGVRGEPVSWRGTGNIALPRPTRPSAAEHRLGGAHTDDKIWRAFAPTFSSLPQLSIISGFFLVYIDAFAGSGDRDRCDSGLAVARRQRYRAAKRQRARLRAAGDRGHPCRSTVSFSSKTIQDGTPRWTSSARNSPRGRSIGHHGDANDIVKNLCSATPWRGSVKGVRGVIFLDPYGMEVEWATVEAIADTKALDLWQIFSGGWGFTGRPPMLP